MVKSLLRFLFQQNCLFTSRCETFPWRVPRLDGARGKTDVWRPMFEPKVFREQMYCIGESTWRHWRPPPSPRVTPLALPAVKIAMSTKRHNNNNVQIAFVSENVASFFAKIGLFKKKLSSKNPLFTLVSFGRKITQNTLAMDCVKGKMKLNRFFHFLRFTQSVCLVWYSFGQSSVLLVASFTFPS